jgi:uncharacterized protein YggU (UPF0235/DUF167 family)
MATARANDDWLGTSGHGLPPQVRVQPRASRSRLDALDGGLLQRRVGAAPVEGGENRAVVELRLRLVAALSGKP